MSSRRRLALFAFEVGLGLIYIGAFAVFVTQSRDFLVVRDNDRATAAAQARQASSTIPEEFVFGEGQADNALLGVDWWPFIDGDEGIWSKSRSFVYVPVPADAGDVDLLIDGDLFVAPGHDTVGLTLTIDGAPAADWTSTYGQPEPEFSVSAPASVTADGLIELRFDVDDAAVPFHFGDASEKREVGLLLRSMTLEAN